MTLILLVRLLLLFTFIVTQASKLCFQRIELLKINGCNHIIRCTQAQVIDKQLNLQSYQLAPASKSL